MPLSRDTVAWAYRILLDRDAESDDVLLPKMRAYNTTRELRHDMVTSDEYHEKNRDFAHSNERNLVIKEIAEGLRLWIDLSDHAIGINILRGRYELNELDFIRRTVRPGQHVVDCGAHIGYFAMHLAEAVGPAGSVTAFEPFDAQRRVPRTVDSREPLRGSRPARTLGRRRRARLAAAGLRSQYDQQRRRISSGTRRNPRGTRHPDGPSGRARPAGPAAAHQLHQGRHRRRRATGLSRRRRAAQGRPPGDPVGTTPAAARPRLRRHPSPVHRPRCVRAATAATCWAPVCPVRKLTTPRPTASPPSCSCPRDRRQSQRHEDTETHRVSSWTEPADVNITRSRMLCASSVSLCLCG